MFWDIEDEQICKSILLNNDNIIKLEEKHGYDYIQKTIEYFNNLGYNVNDIFKSCFCQQLNKSFTRMDRSNLVIVSICSYCT